MRNPSGDPVVPFDNPGELAYSEMYVAVGEPFDSSRGAGPAQGLSEESWQNGYCTGL